MSREVNKAKVLIKPFIGLNALKAAKRICLTWYDSDQKINCRLDCVSGGPDNHTVVEFDLYLSDVADFNYGPISRDIVCDLIDRLKRQKVLHFWDDDASLPPPPSEVNMAIDQVRDMLKQDFGVRAMDGVVFQIEAVTGASIEPEDAFSIVEAMLDSLEAGALKFAAAEDARAAEEAMTRDIQSRSSIMTPEAVTMLARSLSDVMSGGINTAVMQREDLEDPLSAMGMILNYAPKRTTT